MILTSCKLRLVAFIVSACTLSFSWQPVGGFSPAGITSLSPSAIHQRLAEKARTVTTTSLHMHNNNNGSNNKKKASSKKKSSAASGKGFSSSILQASSSTDSFPYAGTIRPGKQSPQRIVMPGDNGGPNKQILLPDYALDGRPKKGSSSPLLPWVIEVKTPEEIEKMRASGKLAREVLDMAGRAVAPGVTTDEIDALVHEAIVKAGAYPSPLNYHGK
jgi:hypothetical protein